MVLFIFLHTLSFPARPPAHTFLSSGALCQVLKARGKSRSCPEPEEQLQCKPAELTQSPRATHMHYSNQSILNHPDTLDIWVSVSSLPSPPVFSSRVFPFSPGSASLRILRSHSCVELLQCNYFVICFHI